VKIPIIDCHCHVYPDKIAAKAGRVYFRHQKEKGKKTVRGTLPRKTHRKK
jgi:hypothetical protein